MNYTDRIYGKIEIKDPVILDLINCPALQRLKDIDQAGYFEPYFPNTAHSRFEHSVGTFLLLKKYNAPIEEQIAGLIHDVSHSAFSHCIDYVLDAGSEKEHSYQDSIFANFVQNSEIPKILENYNIDLGYVLDDKNFPLKEKDLPDLCADRIDYSLRTAVIFGEVNEITYFLSHLKDKDGDWIFDDFESAEEYARLFLKLNKDYYSGLPSATMFRTVGDCLKYALKQNYISLEDLYTTDKKVIEKIANINNDNYLETLINRMDGKIKTENNLEDYNAIIFCKSRVVDPLCVHNGAIKRISEVDNNWKNIIKEESKPKQYFLKFAK